MCVDILALMWGASPTSPGVVVAGDREVATVDSTNQSLSDDGAAAVAQHVADLHNAALIRHTDDEAVDRFAGMMKAKLARQRAKGYGGWDDPARCTVQTLARELLDHIRKGDPLDVGAFAMMLTLREGGGEAMLAACRPAPLTGPCKLVDRLTGNGAFDVRLSEILIDLGHRDLAEMVAQAAKLLVEAGVQLRDRLGNGGLI